MLFSKKLEIIMKTLSSLLVLLLLTSCASVFNNKERARKLKVQSYIEANKMTFIKDLRSGEGMTIEKISEIYNCDENVVGQELRANRSDVAPTMFVDTIEMVDAIETVVIPHCKKNL
jgi:hypothetical protein